MSRNMSPNVCSHLQDQMMSEVSEGVQIHRGSVLSGNSSGTVTIPHQIPSSETSSSHACLTSLSSASPSQSSVLRSCIVNSGQSQRPICRVSPRRRRSHTSHPNTTVNPSPSENELPASPASVTNQYETPVSEVTMETAPLESSTHTQQNEHNTTPLNSVSNIPSENIPDFSTMTFTALSINDGNRVTTQETTAINSVVTNTREIHQHNSHTATSIGAHPYARRESRHPRTSSDVSVLPLMPAVNSTSTSETGDNKTASSTSSTPNLIQSPRAFGIFVERPKHPELASYEKRLKTFTNWPGDHHLSPESIARAGLYFVGRVDCARCYFCGGGLRNWQVDDDPLVEHARWFPRCAFISQYMGQDFVDAVKSLRDTLEGESLTLAQVTQYMKNQGLSQRHMYGTTFNEDNEAIQSVVERGMDIETVRSVAMELRESGKLVSAEGIIDELDKTKTKEQTDENQCTIISGAQCSQALEKEAEIQQLRQQKNALKSNFTCKICMDREVQMAFLPCGHISSCQECSAPLINCPVCRTKIHGVVRIYFP